MFGYDLLNEPETKDTQKLLALYKRVIAAIRKHDKEHLIIIEGTGYSRDFNLFTSRLDNNMLYSPHIYNWWGGASVDQHWIDQLGKLSKQHDIPIWENLAKIWLLI